MSSDKYSDGRAVAVFDKKDNFLGLRGRGAGAGELVELPQIKDGKFTPAAQAAVRGAVGPRSSGWWSQRIGSGNFGEIGFASTFMNVFEVPFPAGTQLRVRGRTTNDLFTDTGTGASHNNGNGRYALNSFSVAAGSAWADNNPKQTDGTTDSTFVSASTASWSSVDGNGPTSMVQFTPAAPADGSTNGVYGYAATPWLEVTTVARRDGRPGSILYATYQFGGGGASSQHPRGYINASTKTMQNLASVSRYRTMRWQSKSGSNWDNATDLDSGFHPMWFEVQSAMQCVTVARTGDSTRIGTATTGNTTNAVWRAVTSLNASDASRAYGYIALCCGGTAAPWFHGQTLDRLRNEDNLPTVLFLQVTSQNVSALTTASPFTETQVKADWARALQIMDLCDKLGVAVVLETQQPTQYIQGIYSLGGANQATALAMEQWRTTLNGWIRASGRVVLDMDAILVGGTYSNGIAYLRGYLDATGTGDGVHNNDTNEALITPFAVEAIQSAMYSNTAPISNSRQPKTITYNPAADGTKTAFSVPHGMGATPLDVTCRPGNALTAGTPMVVSFDSNQVTATFTTAPTAGALSLVFKVFA